MARTQGPPRVLMLLRALAEPLAKIAGDAFKIVGPWAVSGDWEEWLDQGGGQGIRVAITSGADPFNRRLLERLPDLKAIVAFGAGHEGVDLQATSQRGIRIRTAGATHAGDVADHAVGMVLAARRRLFQADRWVRDGHWPQSRFPPSHSMANAQIGIVGLGNIGRSVAQRLDVFGCQIRWWGPHEKPDVLWARAESLLQLAGWSDILVVAIYAHDSTRKLISRDVLDALGSHGCLVNMSRGFVIDEAELIAALKDGRLGQAALDVFESEPHDGMQWRDVPNTILSAHCAGDTVEAFVALCQRAVASARELLDDPK